MKQTIFKNVRIIGESSASFDITLRTVCKLFVTFGAAHR
jgi:flavin-binding protein dodecin